ncbi:MAG: nitrilase-related carbon-nitrogen hydrolase, partial [Smithellaceae bacterium]
VENQVYVVGVNRVGEDGNGIAYSGDSAVIDPLGNILFQQADIPCAHTAKLSYDRIREYRETFAVWQDADGDAVSFPR